jgi:hypothetical protein
MLAARIHLLDSTRSEITCQKARSQGKSMQVPIIETTDARTPVGSYAFTLILDSERDWELEELANAVYEAGFRDDVVGLENGKLTLAMEREGQNGTDAMVRAIYDVERAPLGLNVVNFYLEPDANDGAEAAEEDDSILRAALVVRRNGPQVNRVVRELQGT